MEISKYTEPKIKIEDHHGEIHEVGINQFSCTGVCGNWDQTKKQIKEEGRGGIFLNGYFFNPDGILTTASRLDYYLEKEKSQPQIIQGGIAIDDRGQIIFANDFNFADRGVKRFYAVSNHEVGFIRAWHYHKKEAKYAVVLSGAALVGVVWVEDIGNPQPDMEMNKVVLSGKNQKIFYIPAGYANGFKSLEPNTTIIFFSTSTLQESQGDDFRIKWDFWNIWDKDYR